jgi:hypothetical protein
LERGVLNIEALSGQVENAAQRFAANTSSMMALARGLDFTDDVPHQLLTVRLKDVTPEGRETAKANIPTRHLLGYVVRALAALDVAEQTKFFSMISSHPWLRGAAGWCFEKFVHMHLVAHPLSKSLKTTAAKRDSPRLVVLVCKQFCAFGGLNALASANSQQLPFYWRLISTQFTSLDAIICTSKEILLLQTTISRGHGVKPEGIQQVLGHLPKKFQEACRICLVFITDNEEAAVHLRNQHLPGLSSYNLHVYSSVITISEMLENRGAREALENLFVRDPVSLC